MAQPRVAYEIFCTEHRQMVKDGESDGSLGEMDRLLEGKWEAMDDAGRQVYERKAAEEWIAYGRPEMPKKSDDDDNAAAVPAMTLHDGSSADDTQRLQPRQPKTAFMIFQAEHRGNERNANPDASMYEIIELLAEKFHALDAVSRQAYDDKADQELQQWSV